MIELLMAVVASVTLPAGAEPAALELPHFPDKLHAFVWRNWQITPLARMAEVVGATPDEMRELGHAMGLAGPPAVSDAQWRRSYITVIRANWHLLPYEQLLKLLGWTPEHLEFTLREDDFLYVKLGLLKPKCPPIRYASPDERARRRAAEMATIIGETFGGDVGVPDEPLFDFIEDLSTPSTDVSAAPKPTQAPDNAAPRYCYSYFALYGDPLLEPALDPYPDEYLGRLKQAGVNGIWLQGVLFKLCEFPWDPALSEGYQTRLANLNALIARAKRHGIGVYLYLNEPRSMPVGWFTGERAALKGVAEGEYAALCTSQPDVQRYLRDGVASVLRTAPELAGVFTISASENLTSCWSHYQGATCPRCSQRQAAEVVAEANSLIAQGVRASGSNARMIVWDWGWQDAWAVEAIGRLPHGAAAMSVSEWSLPIKRGGVETEVGEYSISAIGPGPRAKRHWSAAKGRGLGAFAKMQVGTTWELGSAPYLPALYNVAEHARRVRAEGVDGVMLGWTLGGYPSPNLEVFGRVLDGEAPEVALRAVATRRFGAERAEAVLTAWREFSDAIAEYPYHGGVVYSSPHHAGPANLLWAEPTGYRASMVGIPYDDLASWRAVYPPEVFAGQYAKVADGFDRGVETLRRAEATASGGHEALRLERSNADAAAICFRSASNHAKFVVERDRLAAVKSRIEAEQSINRLQELVESELDLARRLYAVQSADSRIGFEATNHYFYVPLDLAEKVLNCRQLIDDWLPGQHKRAAGLP